MLFHRLGNWLSYNLWYFKSPPWDTNQSPPELIEFIQSQPAGKALDLGCGTGKNCQTLTEAGWQTVGVDLALLAVRKAQDRFKRAGLRGSFYHGDILANRFGAGEFDLVLDIGCFHNLLPDQRGRYRENLTRWLKPGGCFLLYGHMNSLKYKDAVRITDKDVEEFLPNLDLTRRDTCSDRWGRQTVWLWFTMSAR